MHTLRFVSIVYIVLLSVGLFAHVETIPALLTAAGRDAWLSALAAGILLPGWTFLVYRVLSAAGKPSIIERLRDKPLVYNLLLMPVALFLLGNAYITAKDIVYWSQLSYMQGFGSFLLAGTLLLFCLFCTESGLFVIGILSSLLCPAVIFLGFFISFANTKKKHYELLFPVFTEGYMPMLKGLLYSALPLFELFIVLFLTPVLKKKVSRKQIFFLGLLILLLTCGPTIGAIVEFGPEHARQYRYPAYEQWRIISIGQYFSHTDFLAVFQWLSGGVIRISLYVLFVSTILTKGKKSIKVVRGVYALLLLGCVYPFDQSTFATFIYRYYRPASFVLLIVVMTLLAIYLKKSSNEQCKEGVES